MPKEPTWVRDEYARRYTDRGPSISRMQTMADHYNGDVVAPSPEVDEKDVAIVANIFGQAIDQLGTRMNSTRAQARVPVKELGNKAQLEAARAAKHVLMGLWTVNTMPIRMARRTRWYSAYGQTPTLTWPVKSIKHARIEEKNPLNTFPAPTASPADLVPEDCIFTTKRNLAWLRHEYPDADFSDILVRKDRRLPSPTDLYDILTYVSREELSTFVIGNEGGPLERRAVIRLDYLSNSTERPLAVIPGRITLDRLAGLFDGIVGMYEMQAKLFSLEYWGIAEQVRPREWIVAPQGGAPKVIREADPVLGIPGIIQGGTIVTQGINPTILTANNTIDRLDRYMHQTASIPVEWGGDAPSNTRTARAADRLASATVDFTIQEANHVFEAALTEEWSAAIAVEKSFFGDNESQVYVCLQGTDLEISYTPNEVFKDVTRVLYRYPYAGTDVNSLGVAVLQRQGAKAMSRRTGMELDPLIDDAEYEWDQVTFEELWDALISSVQQAIATGGMSPGDVAKIMDRVKTNRDEIAEVLVELEEARQAAQVEADPANPELQPGLAAPAEPPAPEPIPPQPGSMQHLDQILGTLRGTSRGGGTPIAVSGGR